MATRQEDNNGCRPPGVIDRLSIDFWSSISKDEIHKNLHIQEYCECYDYCVHTMRAGGM